MSREELHRALFIASRWRNIERRRPPKLMWWTAPRDEREFWIRKALQIRRDLRGVR